MTLELLHNAEKDNFDTKTFYTPKTFLILEILENTPLTLYFSSIYKKHIPETLHNVQTSDM